MPLRLYNTLSGKVEEFAPATDNTVRMYACGPTVYDYGHIGNFRTFVAVDILRRFLRQSGFKLQHVMNITDVDDKIIRNAARDKKTVQEYTRTYEEAFLEDMGSLNLERPEKMVRATEHIQEMAEFIAKLEKKGIAYRTEDGSYYFRIAKFPEYGKLSKKDFAGMEVGARVDVDEYEKDNARDFALWKAPKEGEAFWESPIGPGRPGWHIECSVMSMKYLGDSFDLHAGGEDLTFPHHENEIAQSESLTGKIFSRHWMHVRFLLVEGEKMSKSLGNFYTLRDLLVKGHKPSSIRFLLTSVPYRKQLNFTFAGLEQGAKSVERLRTFDARIRMSKLPAGTNPVAQEAAAKAKQEMRAGMEDDLNTAYASGAIFDMVREANTLADRGELREGDKAPLLEALQQFDEIFAVLKDDDEEKIDHVREWAGHELEREGSKLSAPDTILWLNIDKMADEEVNRLIEERNAAKKARDFARSDAIRKQLAEAGIIVEDTKDGMRWKRKGFTSKAPSDPKEELEKTLDLVIELLVRAKSHVSLGRGISQMVTDEPAILNASPTFWTLTIYAHFDAALLLTFKLFDTQSRAVTIPHLLSLAEANPTVLHRATPQQVESIVKIARNQIVGIQDALTAINARRNRVIAHLESTAVRAPAKLEAATKVTFSDLNKAFTFAADILNEISVALRDISPIFDAIGLGDYEMLGRLVVEAKCEQIKKFESEFGLAWDGPRPKNCPK